MKYEVKLKISYAEQAFEFDNIEEAAVFAKMVLEHSVERYDEKRIEVVMIAVKLEEPTDEEIAAVREQCGDD